MPEAYLAIAALALLVALGALWQPLLLLAPVLVVAAGALAVRALVAASSANFPTPELDPRELAVRRLLAAGLHLAQPLARLQGRLRYGLTPWRRRGGGPRAFPRRRRFEHWSERWVDPIAWVQSFEGGLVALGAVVRRGGDFDSWDLEVRGGTLAGVRISTLVEEHGQGHQLARVRCRPVWSRPALLLVTFLAALALAAALSGAGVAAAIIAVLAATLTLRTVSEAAAATGVTLHALAPASEAPGR
jgi:hypothetical protein